MTDTVQRFDFSVDILKAILWQYNDAENLIALLQAKQNWITVNETNFWNSWYTNVFNLLTANTFGLSVWAYILDVPLYINQNPESPTKPNFGFNEKPSINSYLNFNNSNFSTVGSLFYLTIEQQRFLLRLRYFQLSTRGDVTSVNQFLYYLCSTSNIGYTGQLYMLDGLDMSIRYVFTADDFPQHLLQAILNLDIFPRPAGVKLEYYINNGLHFGFSPNNQNFNHGNFIDLLYT